mmetsp:Transcript_13105/g.24878  ORF Transcript_13105/g.24878 Transcript_13105/m.24878 type:complete len:201 (-) Transcript_13105:141-743(-)
MLLPLVPEAIEGRAVRPDEQARTVLQPVLPVAVVPLSRVPNKSPMPVHFPLLPLSVELVAVQPFVDPEIFCQVVLPQPLVDVPVRILLLSIPALLIFHEASVILRVVAAGVCAYPMHTALSPQALIRRSTGPLVLSFPVLHAFAPLPFVEAPVTPLVLAITVREVVLDCAAINIPVWERMPTVAVHTLVPSRSRLAKMAE